jgi:hypothetical protein
METHGSASDRIVKLVDLQKSSWRKRVELYESIKNRTSNTIDIEFTKKLKVGRNWKGSIDINHDDQLVHIKVAPVKGELPKMAALPFLMSLSVLSLPSVLSVLSVPCKHAHVLTFCPLGAPATSISYILSEMLISGKRLVWPTRVRCTDGKQELAMQESI